jgi:hypothetical protein
LIGNNGGREKNMKRSIKRMTLTKETLLLLDQPALRNVAGAVGTKPVTQNPSGDELHTQCSNCATCTC